MIMEIQSVSNYMEKHYTLQLSNLRFPFSLVQQNLNRLVAALVFPLDFWLKIFGKSDLQRMSIGLYTNSFFYFCLFLGKFQNLRIS